MKRFKLIFLRLLLVIVPVLMALAPAMAQENTVCMGDSTDLSVVPIAGDTYVWELYKDVSGVNFATTSGNCPPDEAYFTGGASGSTVNVKWLTPGTYFFKVTASRGSCTMNLKVGKMIVDSLPAAKIDSIPPICQGSPALMTVHLTGTAPWSITYTDGTTPVTVSNILSSPYQVTVSPAVTTNYVVTTVTDASCTSQVPSNTITLVEKPKPVTNPIWHN